MKQKGFTPSGFTLVELAIVLMIIGLLIGGILKGQELITNVRILTVMRQVKSYEAALITFQSSYGALPGDMRNSATRLPNCASGPCSTAGDGNGIIGNSITSTSTTPYLQTGTEGSIVWMQLAVANLISGIDTSYTGTPKKFGTDLPTTALSGGGFVIGHLAPSAGQAIPHTGHHLITMSQAGLDADTAMGSAVYFPTRIAERIDRKMDDGRPVSGDVSSPGAGVCYTNASSTDYDMSTTQCGLIFYLGY